MNNVTINTQTVFGIYPSVLSTFQGVGIEEFRCIQSYSFQEVEIVRFHCILISGSWNREVPRSIEAVVYGGVLISRGWNRGFHYNTYFYIAIIVVIKTTNITLSTLKDYGVDSLIS